MFRIITCGIGGLCVTIVHSSWASLKGVMAVMGDEGVRTIIEMFIGCATTVMIMSEGTIVHYMIVKDTVELDVVIHRADTPLVLEVVVHMRKVALIDSSEATFNNCTWIGRVGVLRTILRYPKVISSNI